MLIQRDYKFFSPANWRAKPQIFFWVLPPPISHWHQFKKSVLILSRKGLVKIAQKFISGNEV